MRFPAKAAVLCAAVLLLAGPVATVAPFSVETAPGRLVIDGLMDPNPQYRPLILAQSAPQIFWAARTPDELEARLKPLIPAAMLPNLGRGLEAARFLRSEKERLVREADAYAGGRS